MTLSIHSEYGQLKSVLIKPVMNAFRSDSILKEQWKNLNYLDKPDYDIAMGEYKVFESILQDEGVEIMRLPSNEDVSIDSVYCRDATIATDFGMIICNMGKEQRVAEAHEQLNFYLRNGISVLGEITFPGTLEGGDVAWLDHKTLAVGHSYRSNEEGITQLKDLLEPKGVDVVVAELPHYRGPTDVFHLMSILSPVAKDLAVVYSPLMPISFRKELINRGYKLIEVPDEEFESMGCNVLALSSKKCLLVEGNPVTEKSLISAGCTVITYRGEHISIMGGGGPTCLTRPIERIS